MSIKPSGLGAIIPNELQDSARNTTAVILNMTYKLSDVGYPGNTEESYTCLSDRLLKYTVEYLNALQLGINISGCVTDIYIAQDLAWSASVIILQDSREIATKKLEEAGFQLGDCALHYSRAGISGLVN